MPLKKNDNFSVDLSGRVGRRWGSLVVTCFFFNFRLAEADGCRLKNCKLILGGNGRAG